VLRFQTVTRFRFGDPNEAPRHFFFFFLNKSTLSPLGKKEGNPGEGVVRSLRLFPSLFHPHQMIPVNIWLVQALQRQTNTCPLRS